jgi:hypothetical protein
MTTEAHNSAVRRLNAQLLERDRLSVRYVRANGTSSELAAYIRLRTAGDRIEAREAWVNWVDDKSSRGLNAGPSELLAERRAARCTRGLES